MSVKSSLITSKIEENYPLNLAEDYDNVGLLIGRPDRQINKVLVCLEVTSKVIEEAVNNNCEMIISHHPLIFKPVKKITSNNYITSMVMDLIKADINLYAMHTNFDNGKNGMNDILAKMLELQNINILSTEKNVSLYKIVVFVPKSHEKIVRDAILNSGAGHIGNYSHCSFNTNGKGTFMPLEGTSPFIGQQYNLETVDEVRIETIVIERDITKVINNMLNVHPYEEVAYDIYPLKNSLAAGTGRFGKLKNKMSLKNFCEYIKSKLNIPYLNVSGNLDNIVGNIAVVGGAGSDFITNAIEHGCDTLLTGDIKHHDAIDALEMGLNLIDGGHYFTEVLALPYIAEFITSNFDVKCKITNINTNPMQKV